MKKVKVISILIVMMFAFIFTTICAATNTTTINVNGKDVEFTYEVKNGKVVNLKCSSPSLIVGKFSVPEKISGMDVETLGSSAFERATNMTEVVLPQTVKKLEYSAFEDCTSLKKIDLCKIEGLSFDVFTGCTGLEEITIPKTLKTGAISKIFKNCTNLKTVTLEEGMSVIPENLLAGTVIEEITIPSSVKKIENSAFEDCTSLKRVDLGQVESISFDVFTGCTGLEEITIPKTVKTGAVSKIFKNCTNLKAVTLEEGMTVIPSYLLAGTGIEEITIPSTVKKIEHSVFEDCTSLKRVNLGKIESISFDVFAGCTSLEEITIPKTLKSAAVSKTFINCTNLKTVTLEEGLTIVPANLLAGLPIEEIVIPSSVTKIEYSAFEDCTSLKNVYIYGDVKDIGWYTIYPKTDKIFINTNKDLKIYCYSGIKMAQYLKDTGLNYAFLPEYDINLATCNKVNDALYTGKAIKPTVTLKYNDVTLKEGVNYNITYSNNVNAGTATITITGKLGYKGTKKITFKIFKDITKCSVSGIANKTYTGSKQTQSIKVKYGSTTLKNGTDYSVTYSNNTNAGTATVTITGKGYYTGSLKKTFKISARSISKLSFSKVKNYTYTGKAITPNVTVKYGKKVLVKNTDYTLSYSKNKNKGTATITVTGKGNYSGTKKITFKISARKISSAKVSGIVSKTYNKKAQTQSLKLTYNGITLKNKTDYTVSYKNNKNKGTATITIKGKGNFTGTVKKTFKIKAKSITGLTFSSVKNYTYTGKTIKPSITVKDGSTKLKSGTNYTVKYSNNTKVGTATITITGKGNYTGTKKITFKILSTDITKATVDAIPSVVYNEKAITPTVVVKTSGVTLKKDTDYTVKYTNNINVGTATVTITGKGKFKGTKKVTFKILTPVETPTLSTPVGGADDTKVGAGFTINYEGIYKDNTDIINGWEIYEKIGSKYVKLNEYTTYDASEIVYETTIGTSRTFVARAYILNSKGEKVFSNYSNEVAIY